MRSHKLLIVSATMLASTTLAGLSLADNAKPPSTPSTPTTSTTVTTQSTAAGATATTPAVTTPTSTTTTTAADDIGTPPVSPPPPQESRAVTVYQSIRPNTPLLITGGAILVGTYTTTAAFVGANGPVGDKDLFIPVVGPWINIADRSCPSNDCPDETRDKVLIVGSGILQGVGAALIISSFFVPERIPAARINAGPVKMHIAPTAARGGGGLVAIGTF